MSTTPASVAPRRPFVAATKGWTSTSSPLNPTIRITPFSTARKLKTSKSCAGRSSALPARALFPISLSESTSRETTSTPTKMLPYAPLGGLHYAPWPSREDHRRYRRGRFFRFRYQNLPQEKQPRPRQRCYLTRHWGNGTTRHRPRAGFDRRCAVFRRRYRTIARQGSSDDRKSERSFENSPKRFRHPWRSAAKIPGDHQTVSQSGDPGNAIREIQQTGRDQNRLWLRAQRRTGYRKPSLRSVQPGLRRRPLRCVGRHSNHARRRHSDVHRRQGIYLCP